MTRAHVYIVGGVPHLHVTRPGGPTESRPMSPAEVVGLLEEVAKAVLAVSSLHILQRTNGYAGAGKGIEDHSPDVGKMVDDDPPPHYVGALGE